MKLKIATYNVEWMMRLFDTQGDLKTDADSLKLGQDLSTVVSNIDQTFSA